MKKSSILIVDDNPTILHLLSKLLEKEDYLVIEDVPDVLHSGHVHTFGTAFYRGVFVVNSSTWQSQTEFQKKMNLNPMP